jgi:hypothetical protein
LCLRYHIWLEDLFQPEVDYMSLEAIHTFEQTGRADPYVAKELLARLSGHTGVYYDRTNVSRIVFVLARPPVQTLNPQPLSGSLSDPPTLLEIYSAYQLDLDLLGESIGLWCEDVWRMVVGHWNHLDVVAELLGLISSYTGRAYTLETVRQWKVPI